MSRLVAIVTERCWSAPIGGDNRRDHVSCASPVTAGRNDVGVIADRLDKRKLMVVLQTLMGIQAAVLAALTLTHVVRLWEG